MFKGQGTYRIKGFAGEFTTCGRTLKTYDGGQLVTLTPATPEAGDSLVQTSVKRLTWIR